MLSVRDEEKSGVVLALNSVESSIVRETSSDRGGVDSANEARGTVPILTEKTRVRIRALAVTDSPVCFHFTMVDG